MMCLKVTSVILATDSCWLSLIPSMDTTPLLFPFTSEFNDFWFKNQLSFSNMPDQTFKAALIIIDASTMDQMTVNVSLMLKNP